MPQIWISFIAKTLWAFLQAKRCSWAQSSSNTLLSQKWCSLPSSLAEWARVSRGNDASNLNMLYSPVGACKLWQKPLVMLPGTSAKKITKPAQEEDAALAQWLPVPQGSPGAWHACRRQHQAKLKNVKLALKYELGAMLLVRQCCWLGGHCGAAHTALQVQWGWLRGSKRWQLCIIWVTWTFLTAFWLFWQPVLVPAWIFIFQKGPLGDNDTSLPMLQLVRDQNCWRRSLNKITEPTMLRLTLVFPFAEHPDLAFSLRFGFLPAHLSQLWQQGWSSAPLPPPPLPPQSSTTFFSLVLAFLADLLDNVSEFNLKALRDRGQKIFFPGYR